MTHTTSSAPAKEEALLELLAWLEERSYDFTTPTPDTRWRVRNRRQAEGPDILRDIMGWGRPFRAKQAPPPLLRLLKSAAALEEAADGLVATLRVSRLDGRLHLHSASSASADAVFLGPDSYRFVRFLKQESEPRDRKVLEIGVGAGAGLLSMAARGASSCLGTDINPFALALCGINAKHAGLTLELRQGTVPDHENFDLIIANPPYIAGRSGRIYRDGGNLYGAEAAIHWTRSALPRLRAGGRFLLYSGAPIVEGSDLLRAHLEDIVAGTEVDLSYEEIDPDVFGGLLKRPAYAQVERIAAIGAVLSSTAPPPEAASLQ